MEVTEVKQEAVQTEAPKQTGKVTKIFPAKGYGFIRTDVGEHFFFHLDESPALRRLPPLGSWASFTPVVQLGKRKNNRAIRVEVI